MAKSRARGGEQTLEEKLELLFRAVHERRQVTGFGKGLWREFCPHAVGLRGSEPHVFVWQFGGESGNGFPAGAPRWRCFALDDLDGLSSRADRWHRGWFQGFEQHCIDLDQVYIEVDPAFGPERRP